MSISASRTTKSTASKMNLLDEEETASRVKNDQKRRHDSSYPTPNSRRKSQHRRKTMTEHDDEFQFKRRAKIRRSHEPEALYEKSGHKSRHQRVYEETSPPRGQEEIDENVKTDQGPSVVQVALPMSNTPVIRRNQALRRAAGGRRSSLSNRGKRVSSSGNNGIIISAHEDLASEMFYKHLNPELPDPQRMKQILVWCFQRCLENYAQKRKDKEASLSSASEEVTGMNIARVIQEQLTQDLIDGTINISWYNRPQNPQFTHMGLRPNAQNEVNKDNIRAFEVRLEQLEQERLQWQEQVKLLEEQCTGPKESDMLDAWNQYLEGNSEVARLVTNHGNDKVQNGFNQIQEKVVNLESKIQGLKDSIHKIDSLSKASRIYLDRKFEHISQLLSHRQVSNSFESPPSTRDILRALSRTD